MRSSCQIWVLSAACLMSAGCLPLAPEAPNSSHHDTWDALFRRRHVDPKAPVGDDAMLSLARDVTVLEDDIRRVGSITVKTPDVWGDANLMRAIQDFDAFLADGSKSFDETVQAYIARSDTAEVVSSTALSQGLGGAKASTVTATANADSSPPELFGLLKTAVSSLPAPAKKSIGLEPTELQRQRATFVQVSQALRRRNMGDDNCRAAGYGLYLFRIPVSVLPGRETHQGHSAVVNLRAQLQVDEANLRYTFPKLVIADLVDTLAPVILEEWGNRQPDKKKLMTQLGEAVGWLRSSGMARTIPEAAGTLGILSTHETTDAVSQLMDDSASLQKSFGEARNALQKVQKNNQTIGVVIAGILDGFPPGVKLTEQQQNLLGQVLTARKVSEDIARIVAELQEEQGLTKKAGGPQATPIMGLSPKAVFGQTGINDLLAVCKEKFQNGMPKSLELRNYLFYYLGQVQSVMTARESYDRGGLVIEQAGKAIERGEATEEQRRAWQQAWASCQGQAMPADDAASQNADSVSWLIAVQSGILNQNLKRILRELCQRGKANIAPDAIDSAMFFSPAQSHVNGPLWCTLVREAFPLHVFALDPQVEEQNVYDAFSRRREMQIALAYSVAKGSVFTADQKLRMSRQLGLDMAAIGLNRTAVAFSHGEDTFGWYFYPRVQSPPTESTNVGAFVRTVWSTGPTEHYDQKHRKLEPGMRECEVLIAMPSFVTEVSFDVTTNWESLARPGVTKRSYEEMVAQGGRLHRLRMCLQAADNEPCYRPGDWTRLVSRIDQLEQMLGMQTYLVSVPYQYEQAGSDMFDTGKAHLRPVLHGYYGLQVLSSEANNVAWVFLQGKNFHPTLTYVIVGGSESHTTGGQGDVEIISRELLRVKISNLNAKLSPGNEFEIRVGTPAGVSEGLVVKATPAAAPASSEFDWKEAPKLTGKLLLRLDASGRPNASGDPEIPAFVGDQYPGKDLLIVNATPVPLEVEPTRKLFVAYTVKLKSGKEVKLDVQPVVTTWRPNNAAAPFSVKQDDLLRPIAEGIAAKLGRTDLLAEGGMEGTITGTAYLKFDQWPFVSFATPVTVTIKPSPVKGAGG